MKPRPTPIERGALSGLHVVATLWIGDTVFGRPVTPTGLGEPTTLVPPDAVLVEAYRPRSLADTAAVADPLGSTATEETLLGGAA